MPDRTIKCPKCGCDRIIKYYSKTMGQCGDCYHQFSLDPAKLAKIAHQRG